MDYDYYDIFINKDTNLRYDTTPLFENAQLFDQLTTDLLALVPDDYELIAGLESLGFILGAAMAAKTRKGFLPIRKLGKLPGKHVIKSTFTDYTGTQKGLEINEASIQKGQRVLIVDDWIETGAQLRASITLIEQQGGIVSHIVTLRAEKRTQNSDLFSDYDIRALKITEKPS